MDGAAGGAGAAGGDTRGAAAGAAGNAGHFKALPENLIVEYSAPGGAIPGALPVQGAPAVAMLSTGAGTGRPRGTFIVVGRRPATLGCGRHQKLSTTR
jgi:hypothetical protein